MVKWINTNQQGVALISVLLIVALIAASIAAMLSTQMRTFRNTKTTVQQQQALQHLFSIETWVIAILQDDAPEIDDLSENWATDLPPIPIPHGLLHGKLIDLQARVNLNSIFHIEADSNLVVAQEHHRQIANRLSQGLGLIGIGDAVYGLASSQSGDPRLFRHASILLQDELMNNQEYLSLLPFINLLPEATPINVNTASKKVLMSLHPNLDEFSATNLIESRANNPFHSVEDFYQALHERLAYLPLKRIKQDIPKSTIDIQTDYFLLESTIQYGDARLIGQSIFQRKNKVVSLLNRQFYQP